MGAVFSSRATPRSQPEGVFIYLTYGAAWPYSGLWLHDSQYQFSAPTSGPYEGILFWQDRTAPTCVLVGGDNAGACGVPIDMGGGTENFIESCESCTTNYLEGALYFPTTNLRIHATNAALGGGGAAYSVMVADTIYIESNSLINVPGDYSSLANGSIIKKSRPAGVSLKEPIGGAGVHLKNWRGRSMKYRRRHGKESKMQARKSNSGSAVVELALMVFLLAIIMVGTVDFARVFYYLVTLEDAARAGVEYGFYSNGRTGDVAGINQAVSGNAQDIGAFSSTPETILYVRG